MPARDVDTSLHRIYLADFDGSADHFDIQRSLPLAERAQLADREMEFTGNVHDSRVNMHAAQNRVAVAQLALALRAWSFTRRSKDGGEEPWPLPAEPAAREAEVNRLDETLGAWVAQQVMSYYQSRRIAPVDPTNATGSSSRLPEPTPALAESASLPSGDAGDSGFSS